MRLFLALDVPDEVAQELGRRAAEARRELPQARWVRPKAVHLTLAFLGEQEPMVLPILHDHLVPAFAAVAPFELRLRHGGTYPPQRPARVAWVGIDTADSLSELGLRVRGALERGIGLVPDRRGFDPHLTLARCKQPWKRREIERFERHFRGPVGRPFEVTEGVLYESVLGPGGSRYRALERYPLGPGRLPAERQEAG